VITIKEEEKWGISIIKPTSFYSCESEKTKLNWFCYELSMGMYDSMKDNIGKQLKKSKISDEVLAEFSIYMSKMQTGKKEISQYYRSSRNIAG